MIYFVQAGPPSGAIKIGYTSTSVKKRLGALQTSHPEKLTLLGAITGGKLNEKALHKRFEASRMSGEWFHPSEDLLELIWALPPFDEGLALSLERPVKAPERAQIIAKPIYAPRRSTRPPTGWGALPPKLQGFYEVERDTNNDINRMMNYLNN